MKRVIVNVPDQRFEEFLKTMKIMGFESIEEDFEIPEAHKQMVLDRIRNTKDEEYIPWEQVRKDLGI